MNFFVTLSDKYSSKTIIPPCVPRLCPTVQLTGDSGLPSDGIPISQSPDTWRWAMGRTISGHPGPGNITRRLTTSASAHFINYQFPWAQSVAMIHSADSSLHPPGNSDRKLIGARNIYPGAIFAA